MDENNKDRIAVYEIGYLLVGSISEDNIASEADKVRKIITDAGASIITEEMPHRQSLAYTIRRKTLAGSYEKYDEAFFGWVKFELGTDKVVALKKTLEIVPTVLRMLLITTIKENTYLGKRAPALVVAEKTEVVGEEKKEAPATIEEMDKSIDDMVKTV